MSKRIKLWSEKCAFCKPDGKKKKPQATHKVHDMLDKLSTHLQKELPDHEKIGGYFCRNTRWNIISKFVLMQKKPRKKL